MAFQYQVNLNDPNNLGGAADATLVYDLGQALAQVSQYVQGKGTLGVQLNIVQTAVGRMDGGPTGVFASGTNGARTVYSSSSFYELTNGTHEAGLTSDIVIDVSPSYFQYLDLSRGLTYDSASAPNTYNPVLPFMHEVMHGLGIIGYEQNGVLPATYESSFDTFLTPGVNGTVYYTGANGDAAEGGPVQVTSSSTTENYYHFGNTLSDISKTPSTVQDPLTLDLMNGVVLFFNYQYKISSLDLGVLKDLGYTIVDPSVKLDAILLGFKLSQEAFSFSNGHAFLTGPDSVAHDITGTHQLAFNDGTINETPGLVDNLYYDLNNLDVYNAKADPAAHYSANGWHEGRNPDADFSTIGYLATQQDIAAAGINPLSHYDSTGWKEGRDPSANFDTALYLLHNPDVKAANIDPLQHYLTNGQAEGRQAYATIGPSASFTHGSFDAEYYLLANPDVAKAALASGENTYVFAYQHYESNGWHEGRNPDAFFNVNSYLAANPDVKAAGIDPLAHYDTNGWQEGRNPSAAFNTAGYEAQNADVAQAHIDPLQHYLQHGAMEGRAA